ncbi:MAG: hypothetical protein RL076_1384 [Chloroflexota bacterium]|jgi:hypothetical protein
MMVLGTLITLAAALAFTLIALGVLFGVPYTIRTRVASRFRIMQNSMRTRIGTILYFALIAALPTILSLLTAIELVKLLGRVWR